MDNIFIGNEVGEVKVDTEKNEAGVEVYYLKTVDGNGLVAGFFNEEVATKFAELWNKPLRPLSEDEIAAAYEADATGSHGGNPRGGW